MNPIHVDDPNDQRLDPFRSLKGRTDRHDGTFVGESEIVLERLFASKITILAVLITPARAERLAEMLTQNVASHPSPDIRVFIAEQKVIDQVVGYPLHRGVISLAVRPPLPTVAELLAAETTRTVVVLEGVMDPDNVGSVFRHAAGFGVDAVLLHGHTGDPLYRKTIRTSMGWALNIPFTRTRPEEGSLTKQLADAGFVSLALTPARDAEVLTEVLAKTNETTRLAYLLGAEGPGLTDEVMRDSHHRVRIPLAAGVDSLNIATSAAIALYALINAQPARLRDHPRF
jgi:tRNA G18 (ribose-2'-O)-methylase SpoU